MTDIQDWNAQRLDHYAEALAGGHHDEGCEQRARYGLCGCRERKRLAEGRTTTPVLIINYPTCSGCHHDVSHDGDSFVCQRCHATWPPNAGDGEPSSWDDEQGDLSDATEDKWGPRLIELVRAR